jgi:ribosomal-protein-alanine N-acetyltransferase
MPSRRNGPPNAVATGRSVFLRSPLPSDAEEFVTLNRASLRLHRRLVTPPLNQKQFDEFIERCHRSDVESFFICRIEDGAIAGLINLSQIFRRGFQNAYLGYHIGEPFAGRGYMTEAIDLVLLHAFGTLKLHRLEANIQPGNVASISLVKRAGFVREGYSKKYLKISGQWRDHERWAILVDYWRLRKRT